jgi:hypothetical protein
VRDKAMAGLLARGGAVVPLLRQALAEAGGRGGERLRQGLEILEKDAPAPLPAAAARLIALRRPAGAAEALLAYLPCAEDETLVREVRSALAAVAVRDGKPDEAVLKALEDGLPRRRAAAAEALCRAAPEHHPLVRRLLKDPDAEVRLHVALALVAARDRQAVPTLIDLLGELPPELAAQADEPLRILAGEQAPPFPGGDGAWQSYRDAWGHWWRDQGQKIDLAQVDLAQRYLGYTLLLEGYNPATRTGRLVEVDAQGKVRWEMRGLRAPSDVELLPGGRVLVTEQGASVVTERDLKGTILWQKAIGQPVFAAQRLPNGNTFIAARNQLMEVDRAGKEVFRYNRPQNDLMAARRLRDGHTALLTTGWQYIRLDGSAKEVKSQRLTPLPLNTSAVDFLPGDRLLVPEYNNNRVVEYTADGRVAWQAAVPMPNSVLRLANGNTLVCSVNGQRAVELDRTGKVVWEYRENIRPLRALRR